MEKVSVKAVPSDTGKYFVTTSSESLEFYSDASLLIAVIRGITKPAIRRLARRGGVKRISGLIYEGELDFLCTMLGFSRPTGSDEII